VRASGVRARCTRRATAWPAGKTPTGARRWTAVSEIWLNPWRVGPIGPSSADTLLLAEARTPSDASVARALHAVTRLRRSRRPERYYVGRRSEATELYIVSRTGFEPLSHPSYQSSAAFDWGFASAGALELSFALLADTTESRPTELVCRAFCAEVVARLEDAGFVLAAGDIAVWLMGAFSYADSLGRRARVGLRWSALQWVRSRMRRA
jgi:hypothetical protein